MEYLANRKVTDLASALEAGEIVKASGPKVVLVTSLRRQDAPDDLIEVLAVNGGEAYLVGTPFLHLNVNGAGDMMAALFLAHWLRTGSIREALERTVYSVFAVLEVTVRAGEREIQMIDAQEAIANPERRFLARKVW